MCEQRCSIDREHVACVMHIRVHDTHAHICLVASLGWKGVAGTDVATRLLEAYYFAVDDEARACTNNKV